MAVPNPLNAMAAGLSTNRNGGSYMDRLAYDITKKLEVVYKYQELFQARGGIKPPTYREVAAEVRVSHTCVGNETEELRSETGILDP